MSWAFGFDGESLPVTNVGLGDLSSTLKLRGFDIEQLIAMDPAGDHLIDATGCREIADATDAAITDGALDDGWDKFAEFLRLGAEQSGGVSFR